MRLLLSDGESASMRIQAGDDTASRQAGVSLGLAECGTLRCVELCAVLRVLYMNRRVAPVSCIAARAWIHCQDGWPICWQCFRRTRNRREIPASSSVTAVRDGCPGRTPTVEKNKCIDTRCLLTRSKSVSCPSMVTSADIVWIGISTAALTGTPADPMISCPALSSAPCPHKCSNVSSSSSLSSQAFACLSSVHGANAAGNQLRAVKLLVYAVACCLELCFDGRVAVLGGLRSC